MFCRISARPKRPTWKISRKITFKSYWTGTNGTSPRVPGTSTCTEAASSVYCGSMGCRTKCPSEAVWKRPSAALPSSLVTAAYAKRYKVQGVRYKVLNRNDWRIKQSFVLTLYLEPYTVPLLCTPHSSGFRKPCIWAFSNNLCKKWLTYRPLKALFHPADGKEIFF